MAWVESEYSTKQKLAFKGVVIDQRPAREVAEELNLSVNQVYQNKSRILARIRKVFHDLV
jgi:DNA-directed RNA polymerase specialized sigma24 family protein